MFSENCGIYAIFCLVTGKLYIGSSSNLTRRFGQHRNALEKNKSKSTLLQRAWNKYGSDAFQFFTIEICNPENLLKEEEFYILLFQSYTRTLGFNIRIIPNSNLGVKKSEEEKEKMRLRRLGTPNSEESKQRMREQWAENHEKWVKEISERRGRSFTLVSPTGEIHTGKGIGQLAIKHGLSRSGVGHLLNGDKNHNTVKGWHLPGYEPEYHDLLNSWGQKVRVKKGEIREFAIQNNLSYQSLLRVANKGRDHHKGWAHTSRSDLYVTLLGPNGEEETICRGYQLELVKKYNLRACGISHVITGRILHSDGWCLKENSHKVHNVYRVQCPDGVVIPIHKGQVMEVAKKLGIRGQYLVQIVTGHKTEYKGYKAIAA